MTTFRISAGNKNRKAADLSKEDQDKIVKYVMTHMEDPDTFRYLMAKYKLQMSEIITLLINRGYL